MKTLTSRTRKAGFSLVELTIVVVILGVLATFAVPRFMSSVERTKAAEAFNYLHNIQQAEANYNARTGRYTWNLNDLDIKVQRPKYFYVYGPYSYNWETGWMMALVRNGSSSGHGRYTVWWNQDGFDSRRSSIPRDLRPTQ